MHDIKIQNFYREYPSRKFPDFKTISLAAAEKIKRTIASKLSLPQNVSPLDLVKELEERSTVMLDENAGLDGFNLRSALSNNGIFPKEAVFINWYRFDEIDEIGLADLSLYFDDIWYPSADYIDVFDDSFTWMLSIGYSGEVLISKFG